MDMKKAINGIATFIMVALVAGVMMVSTVSGVFAQLDSLPAPFVTSDGKFDSYVVVGTMGSVDDVAVGMDVATTFGQVAVTPATTTGGTTTTMSSGLLVHTPGVDLNYGGSIGGVLTTGVSGDDLSVFAGHKFVDNKGTNTNSVDYTQNLAFTAGNAQIVFDKDTTKDTKDTATYLKMDSSSLLYTYKLKFDNDVNFDGTSSTTAKDDLQGTTLNIQGKEYTISDVKVSGNKITQLDLLSGTVTTTQGEYTTQSYTVKGTTYTVEIPIISDSDSTVKFVINGETTDALAVGQTYTLSDGTIIGVKEVMPNEGSEAQGADQVTFYLGADKVVLKSGTDITINGAKVDGYYAKANIIDNGINTLKEIDITLQPKTTNKVFLGVGDSWTDPVFGQWKIDFTGIQKTTESIDGSASSNNGDLTFKAVDGKDVSIPVIEDANSDVWFGEDLAGANVYIKQDGKAGTTAGIGMGWIANGDSCDVGTASADLSECVGIDFPVVTASGNVHIFQLTGVDKQTGTWADGDDTYSVTDLTTGTDYNDLAFGSAQDVGIDTITLTETATGTGDGDGAGDDFVITATAINHYTGGTSTVATFETHNGAEVQLSISGAFVANAQIFDGTNGASLGGWTYQDDTTGSIDIVSTAFGLGWNAASKDSDTSYALDAANWGALFTIDTNNKDSVSVAYPTEKAKLDVYISPVAATTTTSTSGPVTVNKIDASTGIARVDTDFTTATPDKPVILIGGPGANKMVKALADANLTDAASDYAKDTAIIQEITDAYGTNDALIVAGYAAKDTNIAGKVLSSELSQNNFADKFVGDKIVLNTAAGFSGVEFI